MSLHIHPIKPGTRTHVYLRVSLVFTALNLRNSGSKQQEQELVAAAAVINAYIFIPVANSAHPFTHSVTAWPEGGRNWKFLDLKSSGSHGRVTIE